MSERSEAVQDNSARDASLSCWVEAKAASGEGVPVGYKRTEVGVIPEDWDSTHLKELVEFLDSQRKPVKSSERAKMSGIYPYYGASGIVDYVNDYLFDEELILLGEDGENIISRNLPLAFRVSGKLWVNNHAHVLRPNKKVSIGFLTNFLESQDYQERNSGTAQPKLNRATCGKIPVALPDIEEQRAIATALSDADALIESLDRLIAKKRAIKQATMQQLLTGQTRLPGFTGEWETKRLGDLGTTYGGLVGKTKKDFGVGTGRYITFLNIVSNTVIDCSAFEAVSVGPLENQHKVAKGDLFFNGSSETPEEVGMCAVLNEEVGSVFLNSFCFGFRLQDNEPANPLYLAYYFRSQEGREILKMLAQGATRYNLSKTALMDVVFPVPEVDEQNAIATVLADMDTEIEALEHRRDKARQIKQGMMQQLLTGRVRLVAPQTTEPVAC